MAMRRFSTIVSNTIVSPNWIMRIGESSSNGRWEEVITHHYLEMKRAAQLQLKSPPDLQLFPIILKACSSNSSSSCSSSSHHGKVLHACLIKQGLLRSLPSNSIGNSIVNFYIKSGDLPAAVTAFDSLKNRDSVSWNILIYGHLNHGALREGLWWFARARLAGFGSPNTSTLVLLVQACRFLRDKHEGMKLHGYFIQSGFWALSSSVQNSLLGFYVETDMDCARQLFDEIPDKDVISWSVIISAHVQHEEAEIGLQMFRDMLEGPGIQPDGVIVVSVLKGCADLENIGMGRSVHGLVIYRGLYSDLFVQNFLIDMYSYCQDVCSAFDVFNEISLRNNVSWNSMLSGFVYVKNYAEALSITCSMAKKGICADEVTLVNILQVCKRLKYPSLCKSIHCLVFRRGLESNELLLNTLIDAYAKVYLSELAWEVFVRTKRKDVVLWSTMIGGFAHCGRPDEAIAVFQKMNETMEIPNAITILNLLEACSVSADLNRARWAHGIAVRRCMAMDVAVGTAIVDMYAKCGKIDASRKAFDQVPLKNVVSWSAMIAGYGMNGFANEVAAALDEMKLEGVKLNAVTALSVLSACSHGGLVEEGLSFFKSMTQDYGLEPGFEHYSCVVDMLSRAGKCESAVELMEKMPANLKAGASAWGAILSGCRSYGNVELGEGAVSHVLELEPLNWVSYALASSIYAGDGLWDDAARMRVLGKERGVRVVAGYSLVHIDSKAHRFVAGDKSHPERGKISYTIQQLHDCMYEEVEMTLL